MLANGSVIYGINTGFGGSANVRCQDCTGIQQSLIRNLNAGFGAKLSDEAVRAALFLRITCLGQAYSGVRPELIHILIAMFENDIIPAVPLRGSISASGDLVPMSYIAAAISGRDIAATVNGCKTTIKKAFDQFNIKPLALEAKEGLAIANSCSVSVALGANVLYDACTCILLTQLATALSMEAMEGKLENFHPTPHCKMPHPGQMEVAANMRSLLSSSSFCIAGTLFKT